MNNNKLEITPPLYMVGKKIFCWKCQAKMPVITLLAPKVEGTEGEICLLGKIRELPNVILSYITNRVPTFRLKFSKMAADKYYGNVCPKCGILTGEFFLDAEPGATFFPTTDEEAKSLYITEIPAKNTIFIEASISIGVGELILKNAKRI